MRTLRFRALNQMSSPKFWAKFSPTLLSDGGPSFSIVPGTTGWNETMAGDFLGTSLSLCLEGGIKIRGRRKGEEGKDSLALREGAGRGNLLQRTT